MAINTFNSHIEETGQKLQEFRKILTDLEGLYSRHTHNNYIALVSGDFDGRAVNKTQYDNAYSSINDLLNIWLAGGHGTNIDQFLFERP